ncbi:YggS family pyridoxal phosphate-dependent enzyme [Roseivirga sp. UBA1976]|uniref:YggS family pyridoxal phosphate-dependent enzyme n=1 Tax=Roseivirga sp. UBA1976 TaxID=1947386 RepID=UPI00257ECB23|nr:YggS family pyridoxal phosphate-dependent enzyme [Roseivirga sp. UBA1976]MEC7752618.1 YggS family pyridoxal phosphate-dependent enzyme [Bacteroidota bacterium]|tara:strand:+ start:180 stop:854 length:675 start_codon:yes stop_codon:yes gene_type:complete
MSIAENIAHFNKELAPFKARLIAVSKTKPNSDLLQAYECGQRDLGENKVQELTAKYEALPKDIRWHMIGHLQRNKVKYIAPFVHLIHGVDSLRLLREINKQAQKHDRVIDCLLQIFIASEETKFGLDKDELFDLLKSPDLAGMENIRIVGFMGMATNTENQEQVRSEFRYLKNLFDEVAEAFRSEKVQMKELSMGMTGDYKIALEEGSTMVRVGSAIFGERNYH